MGAGIAGTVLAALTISKVVLSPAIIVTAVLHSLREGNGMPDVSIFGLSPYDFTNSLAFIIIAVLTIGVYKRNKLCAISLSVYGGIGLVAMVPFAPFYFFIPIVMVAVILVFLFIGMIGTFDYHQLKATESKL
jgi:hypothetical protein